MRLKGKVALISGGAHGVPGEVFGFGGATAWLFVREGAKVVLGDIDEKSGQKTAEKIRESGGEAVFVRLDVTKENDWIGAVKCAVSNFGRLDILVNNAGGGVRTNTPEDTPEDMWDASMDVNLKGVYLGSRHAIPEMRKMNAGAIVSIGSISGTKGGSGIGYRTAKGAVAILTKAIAIQYAQENIRVNCVHPGYFDTPMTHQKIISNPNYTESHMKRSPMKKWGHVDDIAYGVLYLASDEASFVTGTELIIDGGVTAEEGGLNSQGAGN